MSAPNPSTPSRSDLAESPPGLLKAWLQCALERHAAGQANAFAPYDAEISEDDFPAAGLRLVYEKASPGARAAWRTATAELLAELPETPSNGPAFEVLLDLTRFLPVYAAFESGAARLRSPAFGALLTHGGHRLFDVMVRMAFELATPTKEVRDFLSFLAHSEMLDRGYAGGLLVAMTQADPEKWASHLEVLRPRLCELQKLLGYDSAAMRRTARRFLTALGKDRLDVHQLVLAPYTATRLEQAAYDDWLFDALVLGPEPLISWQEMASATHSQTSAVLQIGQVRASGFADGLVRAAGLLSARARRKRETSEDRIYFEATEALMHAGFQVST